LKTTQQKMKENDMKLSNQALGAIMMALQKSLLEQTDIVPVLQDFNFQVSGENEELIVNNPPNFKIPDVTPKHDSDAPPEVKATTGSD